MKTLIYPLILLCVSIASASAQVGNYEARMEDMLVCYDNANNAAGRRVALDSMFTIDKKYLGEAFKKCGRNWMKRQRPVPIAAV